MNCFTFLFCIFSLCLLQQRHFTLFCSVIDNVHAECLRWDAALVNVQKAIAESGDGFLDPGYQIKVNCHVRFINLPTPDSHFRLPFPNTDHIGLFVEAKGNVIRATQAKLLERRREYICSRCKEVIVATAEYSRMYVFEAPRHCSMPSCKGTMEQKSSEPLPIYCIDYQDIKIQELLSDRNIPRSITVTLENDLVDSCQPGDCITIW